MKLITRGFPFPEELLAAAIQHAKSSGIPISALVRQALIEKLERETGKTFHNPQWGERTDLRVIPASKFERAERLAKKWINPQTASPENYIGDDRMDPQKQRKTDA